MASFWRVAASKSGGPLLLAATAAAAFLVPRPSNKKAEPSLCDAAASSPAPASEVFPADKSPPLINKPPKVIAVEEGMRPDAEGDFHGLFPKRQLWVPRLEFPLWDADWDGRQPASTGDPEEDHRIQRRMRKTGVTRHIILVRHAQYDEAHKEDEKRILTPLGRAQAHLTGKRIAEMMKGAEDSFGPCHIRALRVSGLARARETAEIVASYLPGVKVEEPDVMLNEGRPCHTIPGGPASAKVIEITDAHHPRIEGAFRKYFYRAPMPEEDDNENSTTTEKHEFEIIICHANVIRYLLCRALQLPPETWLRYCPFNCSLTYLTIRPTGTVSCRMMGDIGHLPYNASTFSGHHGYNW